MKILVVGVGPWNDIQYGNNVMTNWFKGYDAEFANIYVHTGTPCNSMCEKYLQITDSMMMHSILGAKAGKIFTMTKDEQQMIAKEEGLYVRNTRLVNKVKSLPSDLANLAKDAVWLVGRINNEAVEKFVTDFNPDIIFCHRVFGFNFRKLERLIRKYTKAPMVAFTGDSEISLNKISYSPLFWLRQVLLNLLFRKHIKLYSHYFTFCEDQAKWYESFSGVSSTTLYKGNDFSDSFTPKEVGSPIKLVYAGNIIYNRWKTLAAIVDALEIINRDTEKMLLDIYVNTHLTKEVLKKLNNHKGVNIHGRVAPSELVEIYNKADIALHIESFTKKYRLATKDSFSTKIVDLMTSTCAIMAVCWKEHNGLKYLKKEDAAICIDDLNQVKKTLESIYENPSIIKEYAQKAWSCGQRNHTRVVIQNHITAIFERAIQENKT
ncbi:glycosyltransferase family 1 protein [Parabacteroides sp. AF18-52]|jgi:hypothetical protein|uniref:glycosyltransferase family protein n=1 Tax=Parabacteroides sp. AF18-52 TaxID=2292242 RepID=UPI000EFE072D|nr:glycosyltransferase [Parabacteroides sp. AF18-52]RHR43036.1 glycosyltransferase family 1 protein [Parabacteroides sp. AF18-52]